MNFIINGKRLRRALAYSGWVMAGVTTNVLAGEMTLEHYLHQVRTNHPFFTKEGFTSAIEREQQRRYLGDQDWVIKAGSNYRHDERTTGSAFIAEEQDSTGFNLGLERTFWSNGSRLSLDYDYSHTDRRYAPPTGELEEYSNGVSFTYSVPLLKNSGGTLSRFDYDYQAYNVDLSKVNSQESQEQFLEEQALLFLDWVLVTEQRRIAERRLDLANQELLRAQKKHASRVVAKVDVLRARDSVISTKQNLRVIESLWRAYQAELATQSRNTALYDMMPLFDLYTLKEAPSIAQALEAVIYNSRQLRAIDIQVAQLERLQDSFNDQLNPELDLVVGGGLNSESAQANDSTQFNQPQYMISVNLTYPLGQRSARADVAKARLQRQQLSASKHNVSVRLEAQLRNLLVQLIELRNVIVLNQEQIEVARLKTIEELNRYNQGRSELSFVIQSRDNEQNAQLAYASNAAKYHKLWLRYLALTDALLPSDGQEKGSLL